MVNVAMVNNLIATSLFRPVFGIGHRIGIVGMLAAKATLGYLVSYLTTTSLLPVALRRNRGRLLSGTPVAITTTKSWSLSTGIRNRHRDGTKMYSLHDSSTRQNLPVVELKRDLLFRLLTV